MNRLQQLVNEQGLPEDVARARLERQWVADEPNMPFDEYLSGAPDSQQWQASSGALATPTASEDRRGTLERVTDFIGGVGEEVAAIGRELPETDRSIGQALREAPGKVADWLGDLTVDKIKDSAKQALEESAENVAGVAVNSPVGEKFIEAGGALAAYSPIQPAHAQEPSADAPKNYYSKALKRINPDIDWGNPESVTAASFQLSERIRESNLSDEEQQHLNQYLRLPAARRESLSEQQSAYFKHLMRRVPEVRGLDRPEGRITPLDTAKGFVAGVLENVISSHFATKEQERPEEMYRTYLDLRRDYPDMPEAEARERARTSMERGSFYNAITRPLAAELGLNLSEDTAALAETIHDTMTPQAQYLREYGFTSPDAIWYDPETWVDEHSALGDWQAFTLKVADNAGYIGASILAARLSGKAGALSVTKGPRAKAAFDTLLKTNPAAAQAMLQQSAGRAGTVGGGFMEAKLVKDAAQTGIYKEMMSLPEEVWDEGNSGRELKKLMTEGLTRDEAKRVIASERARWGGNLAATLSVPFGAPSSYLFGRAGGGGALGQSAGRQMAKAGATEAATEGVQEWLENLSQNVAMHSVDAERSLTEGGLESYLGGASVGGIYGVAGGYPGRATPERKLAQSSPAAARYLEATVKRGQIQNELANPEAIKKLSGEQRLQNIYKMEQAELDESRAFLNAQEALADWASKRPEGERADAMRRVRMMTGKHKAQIALIEAEQSKRDPSQQSLSDQIAEVERRSRTTKQVEVALQMGDKLEQTLGAIQKVQAGDPLSAEETSLLVDNKYARQTDDGAMVLLPKARRELPSLREGLKRLQSMADPDTVAQGRREQLARRDAIDKMNPDQREAALYRSDVSGLRNRRAFEEDTSNEAPAVVAAIDVDSLKWVNDNLGHPVGDKLLKKIGRAMEQEGLGTYHLSGDEFAMTGKTEAEVEEAMQRVVERLQRYEPVTEDGVSVKPNLTWAIAGTYEEADGKASAMKVAREATGKRAKRDKPPIGTKIPAGWKGNKGRKSDDDGPGPSPGGLMLMKSAAGGQVLKDIRAEVQMSLQRLGREIARSSGEDAGAYKHSAYLSRIESGKLNLTPRLAKLVAKATGIPRHEQMLLKAIEEGEKEFKAKEAKKSEYIKRKGLKVPDGVRGGSAIKFIRDELDMSLAQFSNALNEVMDGEAKIHPSQVSRYERNIAIMAPKTARRFADGASALTGIPAEDIFDAVTAVAPKSRGAIPSPERKRYRRSTYRGGPVLDKPTYIALPGGLIMKVGRGVNLESLEAATREAQRMMAEVRPAIRAVNNALGDKHWSRLNKEERIEILRRAAKEKALERGEVAYLKRVLRQYESKDAPIDVQPGLKLKTEKRKGAKPKGAGNTVPSESGIRLMLDSAIEAQRDEMLEQFVGDNIEFKISEMVDEFDWGNIDYDGYSLDESHPDYQTLLDEQGKSAAEDWLDSARADAEPTVREILHRDAVDVLTEIFNGLDVPVEEEAVQDADAFYIDRGDYMEAALEGEIEKARREINWDQYMVDGEPLNKTHSLFKEIFKSEGAEAANEWLNETREWELWENAQYAIDARWAAATSDFDLMPPFVTTLSEFMRPSPERKKKARAKKKGKAGQKRKRRQRKAPSGRPDPVEEWGNRAGKRVEARQMRKMRRYVEELAAEMGLPQNFVKVVNTANELSRAHKQQLMRMRVSPTGMAGFFDEQTPSNGVHIIASYNLASTEAQTRKNLAEVFYHEVVGHFGLRGVIGSEVEMDQWMDAIRAAFPREVAAMPYPRPVQAEEFVAKMAGEFLSGKKPSITPEQQTVWERFLGWVRGWLIKHGFGRYAKGPFRLTEHDILRLIHRAVDAARHFKDWEFKSRTGQSNYPYRMMRDHDIFTSSLLRDIATATRKANKTERKQMGVTELPIWPKAATPDNYLSVLRKQMKEGPVSQAETRMSELESWLKNFTFGSLRDVGLTPSQVVERMPPVMRKRWEKAERVRAKGKTEAIRALGILESAKLFNTKPPKGFRLNKEDLLKYVEKNTPHFKVETFYPYVVNDEQLMNYFKLETPGIENQQASEKTADYMNEIDRGGSPEEDGKIVSRNPVSGHQMTVRAGENQSQYSAPVKVSMADGDTGIIEMKIPIGIFATRRAPMTGHNVSESADYGATPTSHSPQKGAMYIYTGQMAYGEGQTNRQVGNASMYVADVSESEVTFRMLKSEMPGVLTQAIELGENIHLVYGSQITQNYPITVRNFQYNNYVPKGAGPGMYQVYGLQMEYRDREYFQYRGHFYGHGSRTRNKFMHIRSTVSMQADPEGPSLKPETKGLSYHAIELQSENLQKRFVTWRMSSENAGYDFEAGVDAHKLREEGTFRLQMSDYMMQDITDTIINEMMAGAAKQARLTAQQEATKQAKKMYLGLLSEQTGTPVAQLESRAPRLQLPAPGAQGELVQQEQPAGGVPALTSENMERFHRALPSIGSDAALRAMGNMQSRLRDAASDVMEKAKEMDVGAVSARDIRLMDAFAANSLNRWGSFVSTRIDNAFYDYRARVEVKTLDDVKTMMDDMLSSVFTSMGNSRGSLVESVDTAGRAGRLTIEPELVSSMAENMASKAGVESLSQDRVKAIIKDVEKRAHIFTFKTHGLLSDRGVMGHESTNTEAIRRVIQSRMNSLNMPVEVSMEAEPVDVEKTHTITGKDRRGNTVSREVKYSEVEMRDVITIRVAGRESDEKYLTRRISKLANDAVNELVEMERKLKEKHVSDRMSGVSRPEPQTPESAADGPPGVGTLWDARFDFLGVERMFVPDGGTYNAGTPLERVFDIIFDTQADIDDYAAYDDVQDEEAYIDERFESELDEHIENYDYSDYDFDGHGLDDDHPIYEGIERVQGRQAAQEWLSSAISDAEQELRETEGDYIRERLSEEFGQSDHYTMRGVLEMREDGGDWEDIEVHAVSVYGPNSGEVGIYVDEEQIAIVNSYPTSRFHKRVLLALAEWAEQENRSLRYSSENPLHIPSRNVVRSWEQSRPAPAREDVALRVYAQDDAVANRIKSGAAKRQSEQHATEVRKQLNWMASFSLDKKTHFGTFKQFLDGAMRMTRMAGEMEGIEMPIVTEQAYKGAVKFMIADAIRLGLKRVVWNPGDATASRGGVGPSEFQTRRADKVTVTPTEYVSPISGVSKNAYKVEVPGLPSVMLAPSDLPVMIGANVARLVNAIEAGMEWHSERDLRVVAPPPVDEDSLVIQGAPQSGYFLTEPGTGQVVAYRLSRDEIDAVKDEILSRARSSSLYEALTGFAPHLSFPGGRASPTSRAVGKQEDGSIIVTNEMVGQKTINVLMKSVHARGHHQISSSESLRGEGVRTSYDVLLEKYVNAVIRPYGVKVEDKLTAIPESTRNDAANEDLAAFVEKPVPAEFTAQYGEVDIIPQPGMGSRLFVRSERAGLLGVEMYPNGFTTEQEAKDWLSEFIEMRTENQQDPRTSAPVAVMKDRGFDITDEMVRDFSDPTSLLMKRFEDPVLEEAAKRIGQSRRRRTIAEVWEDFSTNLHDRIQQGLFDKFHGIRRAMNLTGQGNFPAEGNPYIQARMTTGLEAVMRGAMEYGAPVYKDGVIVASEEVPGLMEVLSPVSDQLEEWGMYMAGVRAKRLLMEGRERNFTPKQIDAMVALGEKHPVFKEVAKEYAKFNKAMLDFAESAGVINSETRPVWEHADYVPFYRMMDDRLTGPLSNKVGLANQRKPIKQLKGGEAPLGDVVGNIMMNMVQLLDSSMKNRAALSAIDALNETGMVRRIPWGMKLKDGKLVPNATQEMIPMAQVKKALVTSGLDPKDIPPEVANGLQSMMALHEPSGEGVLSVLRDGKREYYYTEDRLLFDAMTQINAKQWGNWMNLFRAPKRLITTMITLDPSFQVANFMRDSISAFVIGRDNYNVLSGAIKGLMGSVGGSPEMRKMISAGAAFESGYINAYDSGSVHRKVRQHTEDLSQKVDAKTVLNTPRKLLEAYMHLSSGVENANRVAIYRAAKANGKSDAQAAYEAKDLMDFSMGGSWPVVQFLIQTVPFMGARLQGLQRLGRGFMENPVSFAMKGMLVSMAGMALYLAYRDDERYKELKDWDKDVYFHFWVGDQHYRLPKPFEVGVIFNSIPERMFEFMYSKEDDAGKHLMKRFGFMLSETFAMNPIPQAVAPLVENFFNYDFFRRDQIVREYEKRRLPEEQYRTFTSPTMRELAKVLPEWLPDKMRSPLYLENLYHGYFASMGAYALKTTDALFSKALAYPAKPDRTIRDYPVVGRFMRGDAPAPTRYEEAFYELLDKTLQVKGSLNFVEGKGEIDRLKEIREDYRPYVRVAKTVDNFNRTAQSINRAMRQVWESPSQTPEQKRKLINDLQRSKNKLFERAYELRPGGEKNRLESPVTESDLTYLMQEFGAERLPEELHARMLPATGDITNEILAMSDKERQALADRP